MKIDMRQYQPNDAWLVFRVDCYVRNQPIDIYMLVDVSSAYVFGQVIVPSELSIAGGVDPEADAMEEHRLAEAFITDSYDLCRCGSGA